MHVHIHTGWYMQGASNVHTYMYMFVYLQHTYMSMCVYIHLPRMCIYIYMVNAGCKLDPSRPIPTAQELQEMEDVSATPPSTPPP
jgi:hypothetical protein